MWFYVAMNWHLLCWSLYLVLCTLATLIFSLQFLHMNVAIKENFPKPPYLIFDFLIGHDFFPFFKCNLRNFWIDWMIFFKWHSWILLNNYSFYWSIFFMKIYHFVWEFFLFSYNMFPLQRTGKILSYIKHVELLIRQRLWFNSLDFKQLISKKFAILIYVAMYWYLLCWCLYLVLWTLATLIFSLQFLHMNIVIKENFPKRPHLIVRYSIFWLILISFHF